MNHQSLLDKLFPQGHSVVQDGNFLAGSGRLDNRDINVIGLCDKAHVGIDLAMQLSGTVIDIMKTHPGTPILLLIDTAGQKMSRRDELLGLNGYIAHLAKCIDVARQRGHRIIGLIYGEAVSAGFLSSGLLADACYAVPDAEVRVMNLPAMSRVTKIEVERLEALSRESAVFAPGVENYVAMGAVRGLWEGDLADHLRQALAIAEDPHVDRRRADGQERGARKLAGSVSDRVRHDPA